MCLKVFTRFTALLALFIFTGKLLAHPMPNSLVFIRIHEDKLAIRLELPIQEFELAYGRALSQNDAVVDENKSGINQYILQHIRITSNQNDWSIQLKDLYIDSSTNKLNGTYKELIVYLEAAPGNLRDLRKFVLSYDVIIHQVVTHFAIIKIIQDFNNGITSENPVEIGVIELDRESNTIKTIQINIDEGSVWTGFKKMLLLGMHHIKEGTDHLLFLLVLLLIAPLTVSKNQWNGSESFTYSLKRIIKIVTAFTLGHSLTLLLIAFIPVTFTRLIEISIAITIFISAFHAYKPIFYNKEVIFTFLFGLIHGMAFASSLNQLELTTHLKLISVFGFNIGIEIMQLGIITLFLPLLYLSKFSFYKYIRIAGSFITMIASIAWLMERLTGSANVVTRVIEHIT